ncbi:MAG: glucose-6-phosphate isomerase [Chloroflexi bacterium]|nr:glucose-6-phosphate isomerase [Chloroflexota bacterium]MCI0643588.1 glucose-6-phosphate isomerase [Chloroflexota bacterium]MCI0726210.1 glucose-6-phosphate isomerase [Chloroflexota bacterium]
MLSDVLSLKFNPLVPEVKDAEISEKHLSDLKGYFADEHAYEQLLSEDPILYRVSTWEIAHGDGDLICGFGILQPGKVGDEYFFTKGHYHEWREAAEIYVGLSGEGYMLLEHETNKESKLFPLSANRIVYVPGYTAHRTINVGTIPLTYMGIYSVRAGHDYGALVENNFRKILVARDGKPTLIDRREYANARIPKGVS